MNKRKALTTLVAILAVVLTILASPVYISAATEKTYTERAK